MISTHLIVLQVTIPLVAAPLCVLVHRARPAWLLTMTVSVVTLAIAIASLRIVLHDGPLTYALGNWAAPWGIEYRLDAANAFIALIVSGISTAVLFFARYSVARELDEDHTYLFYTLWLLCLTGLLGMTLTADAFNVFVFLEISSLSSYALVALGHGGQAPLTAFRYLVLGTIGATFILIGIGLLYEMTGTLNMADIAERIPAVSESKTTAVAFAFFTVGIGVKAAVFPLHFWLPDAYSHAPSAVSAFLAGTATKVSLYVLLRFLYGVFGNTYSFEIMHVDRLLLALAAIGMITMSAAAIFQIDLKRMLAYSSVAQIGYIVLGISLASRAGITASVLHLFNHALIKTALFLTLGCIYYRIGSVRTPDLAGLGHHMPLTMGAFTVAGLGLIGLPMTAGFISKWYLITAALQDGLWPLAALVLASSLLAVAYVWRVVEVAYFRAPGVAAETAREAPAYLLLPAWLLVLGSVYFGIDTTFPTHSAAQAADVLFNAAAP